MEKENNSGLYNDKETHMLDKNLNIRDKVIDKLTDNGAKIPDNPNTLRVLDLFLTGSDTSIHKTAENRTKHQSAQNTEETLEMVAGLIRTVGSRTKLIDNSKTRELELADDIIPLDTVEGETTMGTTEFDVKAFTGED